MNTAPGSIIAIPHVWYLLMCSVGEHVCLVA